MLGHKNGLATPLVIAILLACISGNVGAAVSVTACGQGQINGDAFLAGDLDCTGTNAAAIEICNGTLDFAGFTLTGGGMPSFPADAAVLCSEGCGCTLRGPGTIVDSDGDAVGGRVNVEGLTIDGAAGNGIVAHGHTVSLSESVITNCSGWGVIARAIKDRGSTVSSNGAGLSARRAKVRDTIVTDNVGTAVSSWDRTNVRGATITGNGGTGIDAAAAGTRLKLQVRDSTVSGNGGFGIFRTGVEKVRILDSTVSDNGLTGVGYDSSICGYSSVDILNIFDSILTGNGTSPDCGVGEPCADIDHCGVLKLKNTQCDTSHQTGSGAPGTNLGVCAMD